MIDPLAELVTLLEPTIQHSKQVAGTGTWRVSRSEHGQPFYCAILEGRCRLAIGGQAPFELGANDFVLIPAAHEFVMSSLHADVTAQVDDAPVALGPGRFRLGEEGAPANVQMVIGHCSFGSPNAALLVALLPQFIHVHGQPRLANLVQLLGDEFRELRAVRETVLSRLLDVIFIEALRLTVADAKAPGVLRGLGDDRVATALGLIHQQPARAWSVEELAKEAALSRSGFFARFNRAMGLSPMAYLLTWRMALAKKMLRTGGLTITQIAQQIGYGSASAFTAAFTRHTGCSPARYSRTGS